jgi:hypothetical protein
MSARNQGVTSFALPGAAGEEEEGEEEEGHDFTHEFQSNEIL